MLIKHKHLTLAEAAPTKFQLKPTLIQNNTSEDGMMCQKTSGLVLAPRVLTTKNQMEKLKLSTELGGGSGDIPLLRERVSAQQLTLGNAGLD